MPRIACSLKPDELADRRAVWDRLAQRALQSQHEIPGGVRLVYSAEEQVEATLRELVALEAECCGFALWELRRNEDRVLLSVTAPGQGAEAVRSMFSGSL